MSAAAGLFGVQGIALAAVANAAIVPSVNILCVMVFAKYGSAGRMPFSKVLKQLALNPLILACFAGGLVQVSGWDCLSVLSRCSRPWDKRHCRSDCSALVLRLSSEA